MKVEFSVYCISGTVVEQYACKKQGWEWKGKKMKDMLGKKEQLILFHVYNVLGSSHLLLIYTLFQQDMCYF